MSNSARNVIFPPTFGHRRLNCIMWDICGTKIQIELNFAGSVFVTIVFCCKYIPLLTISISSWAHLLLPFPFRKTLDWSWGTPLIISPLLDFVIGKSCSFSVLQLWTGKSCSLSVQRLGNDSAVRLFSRVTPPSTESWDSTIAVSSSESISITSTGVFRNVFYLFQSLSDVVKFILLSWLRCGSLDCWSSTGVFRNVFYLFQSLSDVVKFILLSWLRCGSLDCWSSSHQAETVGAPKPHTLATHGVCSCVHDMQCR